NRSGRYVWSPELAGESSCCDRRHGIPRTCWTRRPLELVVVDVGAIAQFAGNRNPLCKRSVCEVATCTGVHKTQGDERCARIPSNVVNSVVACFGKEHTLAIGVTRSLDAAGVTGLQRNVEMGRNVPAGLPEFFVDDHFVGAVAVLSHTEVDVRR